MSTFDPNDPFPSDRPRSSPIPGVSDGGAPSPFTSQPYVGPGPAASPPLRQQNPYGQAAAPGGSPMWTPVVSVRRRSGWVTFIAIVLPLIMTVGIVAYVMVQVRGAVNDATEQFDGALNGSESESLGLDVDAETLFDAAAAPAVAQVFEDELAGDPTEFTQVILYPDYAIVVARDPAAPTHIDQYTWRGGDINGPSPQTNVDDLESTLFTLDEVDWAAIGAVAGQAASLTEIEQGEVSHIMASRSTFGDDQPLVVRIYVSGPRDSGFLEVSPSGEVLAVY